MRATRPSTLRSLCQAMRHAARIWAARERERAYLASLNDKQLWEHGLTLAQARREIRTSFWRS
jgi:uncharacterized protein YjiS (DUF1127 family)